LQADYLNKTFTREDNNKQVSCQAATPYTKQYNESGRSDIQILNVLCKSKIIIMNCKILLKPRSLSL